jgi:excisionase family DNA binding protein
MILGMTKPRPSLTTADLIATADVADKLGVHVRTVHRLVLAGTLTPAIRLPGKTGAYLFSAAEVDALAKARSAAA